MLPAALGSPGSDGASQRDADWVCVECEEVDEPSQ
jgi:hypothetical protein